MSHAKKPSLVSGIMAGIVGGLVASWMMNEFIAGPGKSLSQALETDAQKAAEAQPQDPGQENKPDATMKTADAIVHAVTGGRHLSFEEEQRGGPIVHYVFGGLMGGLYGGLAEYSKAATAGLGISFGGVLFAGADLLAVPILNLSELPTQSPANTLVTPFAADLVYGVTTELVRRLARRLL